MRLMWSAIAHERAGAQVVAQPAGRVGQQDGRRAGAAGGARTGVTIAAGSAPSYRCARPCRTAAGTPPAARAPPAALPLDRRPREAGQLLVRHRDGVLGRLGHAAQPGAEHDPEARAPPGDRSRRTAAAAWASVGTAVARLPAASLAAPGRRRPSRVRPWPRTPRR